MIKIYTDGSYKPSTNCGGYAAVITHNDLVIKILHEGFKNTTNNKMEIVAVLMILKCFKKPVDKITIYTDSMYVVGCASLGWQRKKNKTLWDLFDTEYNRVASLCNTIEFKHVKGHATNKWNNYVDTLAVSASREFFK